MVREQTVEDAWIRLPTEEQLRAGIPSGGPTHPYDFGFFPAMARLIMAHGRIGPAFGALFSQIMFAPEGQLGRREREMVAAVASAGQDCHY